MAKMFVYYGKTKAEFIAAGLPTTYNNNIVFIKGDANGNGSCIYTHGTYFANFAEFIDTYVGALNFVKGINVGGQSYNAAAGGGYVAFGAADPTTVAVNAGSNGIEIGLTEEFVTKALAEEIYFLGDMGAPSGTIPKGYSELVAAVNAKKVIVIYYNGSYIFASSAYHNNSAATVTIRFYANSNQAERVVVSQNGSYTRESTLLAYQSVTDSLSTNLGSKDDAANSEGSAFARIANLAQLVSDLTGGSVDSIEGQITKAIDALRTEITGDLTDTTDAKTIEAINDELNALGAQYTTLEPRVKAIEDDYLKAADKTELDGKIKDNTDAIAVLNGNDTVDGSVDKKIKTAINDFATKVTDNNTIDTLKELVDYVAGVDGSDNLASAIAQINDNKGAIETLNGDASTVGSVDKKVKDAIDAEVVRANGAYATKAQGEKADTAYQKPSDGIPASDMTTAVQTSLGKADTAYQKPSNGIPSSDLASGVQTSLGKADSAYQKPTNGIPKSDLEASVQTSLGKADAAAPQATTYTKAEVDAMWEWEVIS